MFNLLGYWAIAPNSENTYIPDPVMDKLKDRFENIYCWFDNDEAGIAGATKFSNKFDLRMTYNPIGEPKDPSDFVEKYSLKDFDLLTANFLKDGIK
jgi:DNA primase